jgi:hypothetical protein
LLLVRNVVPMHLLSSTATVVFLEGQNTPMAPSIKMLHAELANMPRIRVIDFETQTLTIKPPARTVAWTIPLRLICSAAVLQQSCAAQFLSKRMLLVERSLRLEDFVLDESTCVRKAAQFVTCNLIVSAV